MTVAVAVAGTGRGRRRDLRREGGRRFTDLGRYGRRREKAEKVAVGAQTLAGTNRRRRGRDSGDILGGYRV